jgi:hypothetical protein
MARFSHLITVQLIRDFLLRTHGKNSRNELKLFGEVDDDAAATVDNDRMPHATVAVHELTEQQQVVARFDLLAHAFEHAGAGRVTRLVIGALAQPLPLPPPLLRQLWHSTETTDTPNAASTRGAQVLRGPWGGCASGPSWALFSCLLRGSTAVCLYCTEDSRRASTFRPHIPFSHADHKIGVRRFH